MTPLNLRWPFRLSASFCIGVPRLDCGSLGSLSVDSVWVLLDTGGSGCFPIPGNMLNFEGPISLLQYS